MTLFTLILTERLVVKNMLILRRYSSLTPINKQHHDFSYIEKRPFQHLVFNTFRYIGKGKQLYMQY